MPLTPKKITEVVFAIQNASPSAIRDAGLLLKYSHLLSGRWVGPRNRYARRTTERVSAEAKAKSLAEPRQMCQYTAVSIVLHCFDGWSFLSQATESLLGGDASTALHLAYYAELRAAMAFLAAEGISVLGNQHVWFDGTGTYHFLDGLRTHDLVWLAIEKWADTPSKSIRLLKLLRVNGQDFTEWLAAAGFPPTSPTSTELAKDWLKAWSLDLDYLSKDHLARNEVSYRPQGLLPNQSLPPVEYSLRRLVDFWKACEPSDSERFSLLDLNLLRRALERTYRARTGREPKGVHYAVFIDSTLSKLGMPPSSTLRDFLIRRIEPKNHPLLEEAGKPGQVLDRGLVRPLSVMARAILLLRLASAAASEFLHESSIQGADLCFWSHRIGEEIGLWKTGAAPDRMTDLWADVEANLETTESWCASNGASADAFDVKRDLASELAQLKQFQRVGFWGMGL